MFQFVVRLTYVAGAMFFALGLYLATNTWPTHAGLALPLVVLGAAAFVAMMGFLRGADWAIYGGIATIAAFSLSIWWMVSSLTGLEAYLTAPAPSMSDTSYGAAWRYEMEMMRQKGSFWSAPSDMQVSVVMSLALNAVMIFSALRFLFGAVMPKGSIKASAIEAETSTTDPAKDQ